MAKKPTTTFGGSFHSTRFRTDLLLNFMKQFNNNEDVILCIPKSVKKDMQVWAAIATAAADGLPIAPPYNDPPLSHFSLASDAAGRRPPGSKDETGVAAIGFHNKRTWFWF
jgi:hypothetical protein